MPLRFLVVLIVFALCSPADAQRPKKVPRIGFLSTTSFPLVRVEAFQQGLRELGWVEGRNITVEHRHPEKNFDQAAAELVRLSVDIIVTGGPTATRSAKNATATIVSIAPDVPEKSWTSHHHTVGMCDRSRSQPRSIAPMCPQV